MEEKTTDDQQPCGVAEALDHLLDMLAGETARRLRPQGCSESDSKRLTASPAADEQRAAAAGDISAPVL